VVQETEAGTPIHRLPGLESGQLVFNERSTLWASFPQFITCDRGHLRWVALGARLWLTKTRHLLTVTCYVLVHRWKGGR